MRNSLKTIVIEWFIKNALCWKQDFLTKIIPCAPCRNILIRCKFFNWPCYSYRTKWIKYFFKKRFKRKKKYKKIRGKKNASRNCCKRIKRVLLLKLNMLRANPKSLLKPCFFPRQTSTTYRNIFLELSSFIFLLSHSLSFHFVKGTYMIKNKTSKDTMKYQKKKVEKHTTRENKNTTRLFFCAEGKTFLFLFLFNDFCESLSTVHT